MNCHHVSYSGLSSACVHDHEHEGFIAGVSKGFLRALRYNSDLVGDIIPVEFPINLMISAAWYTAIHRFISSPIVYFFS